MHYHLVGVDGAAPCLFSDTKCIEGMESVWSQLDPSTDFSDFGSLLKHLHFETLAH
ncbi:hypothetical protein D3C84_1157070 [compost metagenome]